MKNNSKKDKTSALLRAQSEVIYHIATRLVMLQAAFETLTRHQIEKEGGDLDAYYKTRAAMMDEDFSGNTTVLLNTLKLAIRELGT